MTTDATKPTSGLLTKARPFRNTLRAALSILRISKTAILALALLASLTLNVASLTVASVFNALSTAIGAVAGNLATVRGKRAAKVASLKASHAKAISALRTKLNVQSRRATTLAKSNATLKRTVQQTTRRISGRVARATARSTGSIAAESIPYVGIGVILGVTAWEVSDACETMKDLHGLELAFNPDAGIDTEHTEVCGTQVPTKGEILQSLKASPGKAWDKAKTWASDLPSWEDAKGSAKDSWRDIVKWLRDLFD